MIVREIHFDPPAMVSAFGFFDYGFVPIVICSEDYSAFTFWADHFKVNHTNPPAKSKEIPRT
jgi:hypothetical protein